MCRSVRLTLYLCLTLSVDFARRIRPRSELEASKPMSSIFKRLFPMRRYHELMLDSGHPAHIPDGHRFLSIASRPKISAEALKSRAALDRIRSLQSGSVL